MQETREKLKKGISTAGAVGYGVMYQPPQSAKK
jgi:hypothetical protein